MIQTNKYYLDFDQTCSFFKDGVSWGYSLSEEALRKIDFSKGRFFTLLPETAQLEKIYNLASGGILPQLPKKEISEFNNYWPTPTSDYLLKDFIFRYLQSSNERLAIFEHFCASPTDDDLEIKGSKIIYINDKEVYYLIPGLADYSTVNNTVDITNGVVWHFLVFLAHDLVETDNLVHRHFEYLFLKTDYIIIRAYDGEGYIFWEKIS